MSTESDGLIPLIEKNLEHVRRGAEIGVFRGKTSAALLRHFPTLKLLMIDTWAPPAPGSSYAKSGDGKLKNTPKQWREHYDAAIDATQFALHRRAIWRADALSDLSDAISELSNRRGLLGEADFDFVFLDADHSYKGTKKALKMWVPRVRSGGLVAGHDYRQSYPGVIRAVDEAIEAGGFSIQRSSGTVWGFVK